MSLHKYTKYKGKCLKCCNGFKLICSGSQMLGINMNSNYMELTF